MMNNLPFILLLAAFSASANTAPDFTVTTSDNQVKHLYADYVNQQKLLVIELFFTTCPPCAAHAPMVQALYQSSQATYPGKVEFMLISTLSGDNNVKVAAYKTSKGQTMPGVGTDGGSAAARQPYISNQFGPFQGTPTFIVIAPGTGEVYFDIRGNSPEETIALLGQKIAELLPPPAPTPCFLKNYYGLALDSVLITIDAPAFDTTFYASSTYNLGAIAALQNATYTVSATKTGNALEGITTYDLVLISKHILGLEALTPSWKLLAADINCSGSITTFDIVTARRLILGIDTNLPCDKWRFVADPVIATSNGACLNFRGVKIGELNNAY